MKRLAIVGLCTAALVLAAGTTAQAGFVAYNDCIHAGSPANATDYSGYMQDGGGFETPSGLLRDYSTGNWTTVTATLTGSNITGSISAAPAVGTDAYNVFNGKVNLGDWSTSYNSSSLGWYYQVTFTGLDPTKQYAFVTTANRNSLSYAGSGSTSRWTEFEIIGADSYTNASSTGVTQISPDIVEFNTGYNTANGYVASWTGITAADGSFTVKSQNVGATGPGEPNKSYGMEGFMLVETDVPPPQDVPEPISMIFFGTGLAGVFGFVARRRIGKA